MPITTQDRQHQVEVLTPCTRQYDRFVDPQGRPLQPGTIIVGKDLPFIVSTNGKIYNNTGNNMKQLYAADPRWHKFLVNESNRPGTIANILGSVLQQLILPVTLTTKVELTIMVKLKMKVTIFTITQ